MINIKIKIIIMSIMLSSCSVPFDIRKSDPENAIIPNCKIRISVWCVVKGKKPEKVEPKDQSVLFNDLVVK